MNGFDIAVTAVAGLAVLVGLLKGMVRILVGIATLIVAFVVASRFHPAVAERLGSGTGGLRQVVAYLALFLAVMLAGALVGFLVRKLLAAAMLSWADRLGGAALGLVAAALLVSLIALPVVAYLPSGSQLLAGSVLAPYVLVIADAVNLAAPAELARRYHEGIDRLRARWREART